jgi:NADPH:quinone reductase
VDRGQRERRARVVLKVVRIVDRDLEIVERPTPEPVVDQVLVEVTGAGVNRADLVQRAGRYPAPPGAPPDVPGLEFAGRVVACGPVVQKLSPGDLVWGILGGGGQATHVLTRESQCAPVPSQVDEVEAGGVPEVFMTAHDAMMVQAGLRPGERVLIHGIGGGVGTAAVQLAHALGAVTVGTSRTSGKLERAREFGLDEAVVAGDDLAGVAERIGVVDVVLDLVGGRYISLDLEVCAPRGRILVVGLMGGSEVEIDLGTLMRKRLVLRGTTLRTRADHEKAAATQAFAREVAPLFERGLLRPVVDRIVPLERVTEAYDAVGSNSTFGKVVLAPGDGT